MSESTGPDYDARIGRAQRLVIEYPFAAEILGFYQRLAGLQKAIYLDVREASSHSPVAEQPDPLRSELDYAPLMVHFPRLLSFLEDAGPEPIANAAHQLSSKDVADWVGYVDYFWKLGGRCRQLPGSTEDESGELLREFVVRVLLQPKIEALTESMEQAPADERPRRCPRCDSVPLLGVLRPEGDGSKRFLVCSFCFAEWPFRRIACPACGEETESKLPIFVAEQLPHVRVEACDTCKSYLQTIDLTKNGHAIPVVDDLAALPLSLWAQEHGYTRLQPNLFGT